jgi:VWFA-related protein
VRKLPAAALLALLLVAPTLPLLAQAFSETAPVVVVEVPVQVIRDGAPVRGLTQADFEVYDGRKKQELTGFEVIDLTSAAAAAPGRTAPVPSSAARRHFLILFDLAFSDPKSVVKARQAANQIVVDLHPTDLVAVATYSSRGSQLVLGFTPDRAQISAAITTLGNPQLLGRNPDPLRLVLTDTKAALEQARAMGTGGSGGLSANAAETHAARDEAAIDLLETLNNQATLAENRAQQAAVQSLTRSLSDLGRLMGTVEGRKYVVYLSEGFDSSLLTGTADTARRDELAAESQSGESWEISSEEMFGDTKSLNQVEKMLEELRRADCVVQAVDIAGLRAAGDLGNRRSGGTDTLLNFAKSTGGELFENFNDLGEAMGQMLDRTSVTYLLTFQPDKMKWDGSFHRLKVEVKNQRGARVVFRPGYYAPKPFADRSPLERMLEAQTQVVSGEDAGRIDIAVLTAPFAMPTERAYVPVLVEVDGKTLLAGKQGTTLASELFIYAFDSAGVIQDYIAEPLPFDLAKAQAQLLQSGFKYFGHLELPPGDYSVRVLVRNGGTGESGLRMVPLRVPAFAASEAALLPPFVPEQPGRWVMVREKPRGEYQQAPYPFMIAGTPYIPSSRPVLAPEQETQLALVGYSLGEGQLEAQARVLAADGREVGPAAIQVLKREAGVKPSRLVANVTPPRLPPGEYRLEVKLSAAGTAQTSSTPFVVSGG